MATVEPVEEGLPTRSDLTWQVADLAAEPRAGVLRGVDTTNPDIQQSPEVANARLQVLAASDGARVAADESAHADQVAAGKRELLVTATRSLKGRLDYFNAAVLLAVPTRDRAMNVGADVLDRSTYPLVAPDGVSVQQMPKTKVWKFKVAGAPGLIHARVWISDNPADESSWEELGGDGLTRKLKTLPPGVHYARAAHTRGNECSGYTAPVAFTVTK